MPDRWTSIAGAAPCPSNQIILTGAETVSDQSVLDLSEVNAHGSYDLRSGRLSSAVSFNDPGRATSSVSTDDVFWIVGLPAGTPVDPVAEFSVSGSWNVFPGVPQGDFTWLGSVATDSDSSGYAFPLGGCCHGSISRWFAISSHRLAGERFHLRLRLASQEYRGNVDISGVLSFSGLPLGAGIVSCQGYSAGVTAARRSTWGEIKHFYR
jgi:hypothetical protein